MRVQHFLDTLVYRNTRAETEDEDRDDKGPKLELHAVSVGMRFVRWSLRTAEPVQKKSLISRIDHRVDGFAKHCGTACDEGGAEFRHRDKRVSDERCIDDFFRTVHFHLSRCLALERTII